MNPTNPRLLVPPSLAAAALGYDSDDTIYRLVKAGELTPVYLTPKSKMRLYWPQIQELAEQKFQEADEERQRANGPTILGLRKRRGAAATKKTSTAR